MNISKKIDNLIKILTSNEYARIELKSKGDISLKTSIDYPHFSYIKGKRQLKVYNSHETAIINIWTSKSISIDNKNRIYKIVLENDIIILKCT